MQGSLPRKTPSIVESATNSAVGTPRLASIGPLERVKKRGWGSQLSSGKSASSSHTID